jgi:hypothetical protein
VASIDTIRISLRFFFLLFVLSRENALAAQRLYTADIDCNTGNDEWTSNIERIRYNVSVLMRRRRSTLAYSFGFGVVACRVLPLLPPLRAQRALSTAHCARNSTATIPRSYEMCMCGNDSRGDVTSCGVDAALRRHTSSRAFLNLARRAGASVRAQRRRAATCTRRRCDVDGGAHSMACVARRR